MATTWTRVATLWVLALAAVLGGWPAPADAFIVNLDGHAEECFFEYVRQKRTAFMRIGVLQSSDKYDVRLKAFGPFTDPPSESDMSMNFFDKLITSERDDSQNLQQNGFNFKSEHRGGYYKFCLDNSHSGKNGKVVEFYTSFDISNADDLGDEDKEEVGARREYVRGVTSSLERLKTLLELIRNEQDYYRAREHRHRKTIDSNNSRIMWYTTMEIGVLAILYGVQSFLLHKWFSDRGFLTKRNWAA